jgi:hypothetical protein
MVLLLASPILWGAGAGLVCIFIGLLPPSEERTGWRPIHILLTLHFSVFSRVFFRAEDLSHARAMVEKLADWDSLGIRPGIFRMQGLAAWLDQHEAFSWGRPLAEWGILLVLLAGFAVHYVPSATIERAAARVIPRSPGLLVGVGLAMMLALFSILLSGPRANIYFAF